MTRHWREAEDALLKQAVETTPLEKHKSSWWRKVSKKVGYSDEACKHHFRKLGLKTPYEVDFAPRGQRKANNPPWRVALGEVIQKKRKALDMWPEDFDLSPGTISRVEVGSDYYMSTIKKIADGLGVSLAVLLEEAERHELDARISGGDGPP